MPLSAVAALVPRPLAEGVVAGVSRHAEHAGFRTSKGGSSASCGVSWASK
jgi:hypothetical protein